MSARNVFCCTQLHSDPRKMRASIVFDNCLIIETPVWCFGAALRVRILASITALKNTLPCSFPVVGRVNCDLNQWNPAWSPLKTTSFTVIKQSIQELPTNAAFSPWLLVWLIWFPQSPWHLHHFSSFFARLPSQFTTKLPQEWSSCYRDCKHHLGHLE